MPELSTVALPLICIHCTRPVTVRYLEHEDVETAMQSWICPYEDCRNPNIIGVSGTIVDAVVRDEAERVAE